MSLENVSGGASIRGIETTQAAGVGQNFKVKEKAVDLQANKVGVQSFQAMNSEIKEIKEGRDIYLQAGTSPSNAPCRLLKAATEKLMAAIHTFSAQSAEGSSNVPSASQRSAGPRIQEKLSSGELPSTLATVAGGVDSGKLGAQDAALFLKFGQQELRQYQNWGDNVRGFLKDNEARLPNAASSQERALVEGNIREAKGALANIGRQTEALGREVGNLEKSITAKFGQEGLNVSTPSLPRNTSVVYALRRVN